MCGMPSGSAQLPCRTHGMATRRTGLGHPDLAARPRPNLLDRPAGPRIRRLHRLEEVQNVLCARGRPQSQEPMVGVRQRPAAADGDEAGVAVLGEDHGWTACARAAFAPRASSNWWGPTPCGCTAAIACNCPTGAGRGRRGRSPRNGWARPLVVDRPASRPQRRARGGSKGGPRCGGPGRIRTSEGDAGRFTVCSLWPLGHRPWERTR
jgi:hypothetical protein